MTNKIYTLASGKTAKAVWVHDHDDVTKAHNAFALFDSVGDEIEPFDKYDEIIEEWFNYDDTLDLALQVIADYLENYFAPDLNAIEIDTEKDGTKTIRLVFDIQEIGFKRTIWNYEEIAEIGNDIEINAGRSVISFLDDDIMFSFDAKQRLSVKEDNAFTYYLDITTIIGERSYEFNGKYDKLKIEFDFAY